VRKVLIKRITIFNLFQEVLDIFRIPIISNYFLSKFFRFFIKNVKFKYIGRFSKININNSSVIGDNIILGEYSIITSAKGGELEIQDNIKIAKNVMISADFGGRIFIGNGTIIGPNTVIRSANHLNTAGHYDSNEYISKDIYIGSNCWIAANCVILGGTKLPDKCVVGALSVTNKEYKDASLVCGTIATKKR